MIRDRIQQRLLSWTCLVVLLQFVVLSPPNSVLCVRDDGHIAVESADPIGKCVEGARFEKRPPAFSICVSQASCSDTALLHGVLVAKDETPLVNGPVAALVPAVGTALNDSRVHPHSGPDDSFSFGGRSMLRTVVMLL